MIYGRRDDRRNNEVASPRSTRAVMQGSSEKDVDFPQRHFASPLGATLARQPHNLPCAFDDQLLANLAKARKG
jgi:hypothetical protein